MTEETRLLAPEQLEGIVFVGSSLGTLFREDPALGNADALFDALVQLDPEAAASQWPFAGALAGEPLQALCEALAAWPAGDVRRALSDDFRNLFVGPARKAAPPWGSVYTDRECVIFGRTCLDLRDWMGEHGIDSEARHNKEPEDHIGLMLQLAAWIAQNKPELTAEYLELHLLTWSGHFLDVMEEAAKHPAYHALARLTAVTLDAMQSELGLHPVIPRFYR